MSAAPLLLDLADPRGRTNRKGLLITAGVLILAEAAAVVALMASGAGLAGAPAMACKLAFSYLAISAAARRLHDTGRSGWWLLWATLIVLAWGFALTITTAVVLGLEELQLGALGPSIVFAGIIVPVMSAMMWLHCAPGEPRANRHGPVPRGLGFSGHRAAPITAAGPIAPAHA